MIRHIIAAIATLLAIWAVVFMMELDKKAERFKQIQEIIEKSKDVPIETSNAESFVKEEAVEEKKGEDEAAKRLKALKERAGSSMAFKVSPLYRQKCSSCHGVNGEGTVGPKLIGKSESEIYSALISFKSGERKNYVMYGLLSKMSDEDLKALSKEIGTFKEKLDAAGN